MVRKPSEGAFEAIARDTPLKANGAPDAWSTNSRLGRGLQRLYEPVADEQPDRFGRLLAAIQRYFADGPNKSGRHATFRRQLAMIPYPGRAALITAFAVDALLLGSAPPKSLS